MYNGNSIQQNILEVKLIKYTMGKNGKTLVPAIPKKATVYNPGEVPYLKQLLKSYGEDALTFTIVFWDGQKCVYNKVSKKFEVVG